MSSKDIYLTIILFIPHHRKQQLAKADASSLRAEILFQALFEVLPQTVQKKNLPQISGG